MGVRIRGWGWPLAVLAATILLAATVAAPRAAAALYWGSGHGVGAANLDGTAPQWDYLYVPFGSETSGPACGVTISSDYLYWATPSAIVRRKFEGEGIYPAAIVPHVDDPCGPATDGSHIYWTSPGGHPPDPRAGSLGRANMDGSEATSTFVTGLERPCAVAVEGGHVFWVEHGPISEWAGIGRANLDGSEPQRSFIPFPTWNPSCGIAASGGYLYWGQGEAIARADLDGGDLDDAFVPNTGVIDGIAVRSGHIYWIVKRLGGTASIGRANLDGSEANPSWIPSTEGELSGVAVDEGATPPEMTVPSRPISVAPGTEYNLRSGAVLIGVYVPPSGPLRSAPQGELRVVSRGLSWAVFPGTTPYASEAGSYLWQVRIRSGSGAVGRRIRTQLRRRGRARVAVRLTYTQPHVYPAEATQTVTLRRHPGARAGWVKHPGRR